MNKAKILEQIIIDFPNCERANIRLLQRGDDQMYIYDHTLRGTNLTSRTTKYGIPEAKIEYDRRKAIIENCYNTFIEAKKKDYATLR